MPRLDCPEPEDALQAAPESSRSGVAVCPATLSAQSDSLRQGHRSALPQGLRAPEVLLGMQGKVGEQDGLVSEAHCRRRT
jgi:hypothetical protein